MPNNVKILLVDDEPILRFHLQKLLQELWPEAEVVAAASNGQEALDLFDQAEPDVIFLDIKMPVKDGLEVASELVKKQAKCHVVFLTAYDEYAVQAFEREAVDYLLKPVDENRLLKTITRITNRLNEQPAVVNLRDIENILAKPNAEGGFLKWVKASHGEQIEVVSVDDVVCFLSDDKYTSVFTVDRELVIRKPVKELEVELDPDQFWRIHRSSIINVSKISAVKKDMTGKYIVSLTGHNKDLPVSRSYSSRFKQM